MNSDAPVVLALGAHPDDIEFMMAGTLFALKEQGWRVHYMNLCDGRCGTRDLDAAAIVATRLAESQAACRLLGAIFHPPIAVDLQLYHTTETVAKLVAVVRAVRPRIMLVPSPNDYMEDHMNASRVAVTAAFSRGMRNFPCDPPLAPVFDDVTLYHAMPYGLADGMRRRVRPGLYVDVTRVIERKRQMLACHASQKDWLDASQGLDAYLEDMYKMTREVGRMSGRFEYAEGWRRHSHLGFSAADSDPLREALGERCEADQAYEASLWV